MKKKCFALPALVPALLMVLLVSGCVGAPVNQSAPLVEIVDITAAPESPVTAHLGETPEPTKTPEAVQTPAPAQTPQATQAPRAAETPKMKQTPKATAAPKITATPKPAQTPGVTQTPKITQTPTATATPKATETPKPAQTPKATETPKVTQTPIATATPKTTETPKPTQTQGASNLSYEERVVELVNEERAKNGLGALTLSRDLSDVARAKSRDMRDNGYFAHESPTYGTPFEMMKSFGISYRTAGENIAMGYASPEAVMEGWMNSPGHRANILNASFTHIGVGYVANGHYWTQMFIG